MDKKDKERFTIKFNSKNPRHNEAMQILNDYGKGMSSLIADALCMYVHQGTNMTTKLIDKTKQEKRPARVDEGVVHNPSQKESVKLDISLSMIKSTETPLSQDDFQSTLNAALDAFF